MTNFPMNKRIAELLTAHFVDDIYTIQIDTQKNRFNLICDFSSEWQEKQDRFPDANHYMVITDKEKKKMRKFYKRELQPTSFVKMAVYRDRLPQFMMDELEQKFKTMGISFE